MAGIVAAPAGHGDSAAVAEGRLGTDTFQLGCSLRDLEVPMGRARGFHEAVLPWLWVHPFSSAAVRVPPCV